MEAFDEVEDSLCVPQYNRDGEERVVLFLKMASGHTFQPDLVKRIRDAIRLGLSARHVPSLILETRGIPVRCVLPGPVREPGWLQLTLASIWVPRCLATPLPLSHNRQHSQHCLWDGILGLMAWVWPADSCGDVNSEESCRGVCWGFVGSGQGASEGSPFWSSHIMYVHSYSSSL